MMKRVVKTGGEKKNIKKKSREEFSGNAFQVSYAMNF